MDWRPHWIHLHSETTHFLGNTCKNSEWRLTRTNRLCIHSAMCKISNSKLKDISMILTSMGSVISLFLSFPMHQVLSLFKSAWKYRLAYLGKGSGLPLWPLSKILFNYTKWTRFKILCSRFLWTLSWGWTNISSLHSLKLSWSTRTGLRIALTPISKSEYFGFASTFVVSLYLPFWSHGLWAKIFSPELKEPPRLLVWFPNGFLRKMKIWWQSTVRMLTIWWTDW